MKFVRRDLRETAEISSGGGTRGALREAATLAALGGALLLGVYFAVGLITDAILSRLPADREKSLFSLVDPFSDTDTPPPEIGAVWDRARASLATLRTVPDVPALDYRLIYSGETEPNAFALPGGGIVVTRGLLEAVGNDDIALAFVLGHELGHFAHRDHLSGLGRRLGFRLSIALLFGLGTDALTQRSSDLLFLRYSRQQEKAADGFGLYCIRETRPATEGAERFFETLQERTNLPSWAYMFSTHPDTAGRIRDLQQASAK